MEAKEYFDITRRMLENIDKKIDRIFEKQDCTENQVVQNTTKIDTMWKISITTIGGILLAVVGSVLAIII